MSEHHQPINGPDDAPDIAALLGVTGPRAPVPVDRVARVRAAVYDEWRAATTRRARRRVLVWAVGGVAAAALVALAIRGPWPARVTPEAVVLGVIDAADSLAPGPPPGGGAWGVGAVVRVGDTLVTARERLDVRLTDGTRVRLDQSTRATWTSAAGLDLQQGAVYVATANAFRPGGIEIRTPLGAVRDIGTQFEVRLGGGAVRVRVREGRVMVAQDRSTHEAARGEELTLDVRGGVERRSLPIDGPEWEWTSATGARPFAIEGQSLQAFLDWIAGEHRWQVQFADTALARAADAMTLHGSIEGLTAEEALAAVLPTVGVSYRLSNGVLRLQRVAEERR